MITTLGRSTCSTFLGLVLFLCVFCSVLSGVHGFAQSSTLSRWQMHNALTLPAFLTGANISDSSYDARQWFDVQVPSTVMAGLVAAGNISDPFYDVRLQNVSSSRFERWWYRSEPFAVSSSCATLTLKGVNYRGEVWLNGKRIADRESTVGAFRYFVLDLCSAETAELRLAPEQNVLAVLIDRPIDSAFPPTNNDTDLAISFVDWSPPAPDNNMGLWRDVVLTTFADPSAALTLEYPLVATVLSGAGPNSTEADIVAHLTVSVELVNHGQNAWSGAVDLLLPSVCAEHRIVSPLRVQVDRLAVGERRLLQLDNSTFACLNVPRPALWWPWQMGDPVLHKLVACAHSSGAALSSSPDSCLATLTDYFGIRQVSSSLQGERQLRLFHVNGRPLLVTGGGWAPDLFYRTSESELSRHFALMRHMGLNAVRLEGKFDADSFFSLADRAGIMVLPGFCCCDAWQHWSVWDQEQYHVAADSLRWQVRRLRIHPSLLVFLYSSDEQPPANVEQMYLDVFREQHWPNPVLASAADTNSTITGPTGVKMSGPYAYVPPNYWTEDPGQWGGAWGFLTEGGPGATPFVYESLERTLTKEHLWPINDAWDWHCGNQAGLFGNLRFFTPPLDARYGESRSAREYSMKAQVAAYESHRAMFDAYSRSRFFNSTGVVQWMLNNPWPEMMWNLYDYYMVGGGAYYGTRKALLPLQAVYTYARGGELWVVNSDYSALSTQASDTLELEYAAVDMYGEVILNRTVTLTRPPANSAKLAVSLDSVDTSRFPTTYFLRLQLRELSSPSAHDPNVYWLSTVPDVLEWSESNFYRTPCSSYADYTTLEQIPSVEIRAEYLSKSVQTVPRTTDTVASASSSGSGFAAFSPFTAHCQKELVVQNMATDAVAFFVRVRLLDPQNATDIAPLFFSDNCITLLPGEQRILVANYEARPGLGCGTLPQIQVESWNSVMSAVE